MGRKSDYSIREPRVEVREPVIVAERSTIQRQARRYIPASMPVVCPECGGPTRMADGRHIDPVRKTVLEYRTCARCGLKLAAGRPMIEHEVAHYCLGYEVAIAEYQQSVRE